MISGLFSFLSAAGLSCATRIYPLLLPDSPTLPALTYQVVSNTSQQTFSTNGMQRTRVQFDSWGTSYADASCLRDALIAVLSGYSGTLPDGTVIDGIIQTQMIDFYSSDALQYRCMSEFFIFHT